MTIQKIFPHGMLGLTFAAIFASQMATLSAQMVNSSALAARNLCVCIADSEKLSTPVRITADYAYFRLRDEGYQPDDIKQWAETIATSTASCRDVFVYFKHEESGKGPEFARLLMDQLGL